MKNQDFTILFVNPVPRDSAQGRHKQKYLYLDSTTGQVKPSLRGNMNKVSEDNIPHELPFQFNPVTNKLETGLEDLIINPFKDSDPNDILSEYSLGKNWVDYLENLVKQSKIKKQTLLEIQASTEPGFYNSESKAGNVFVKGWKTAQWDSEPSFLERFKVILYPRPNRFTTETPRGRLAIELIKKHPKIANSLNEVNSATRRLTFSLLIFLLII